MSTSLNLVLAVWGAVVSTSLAILHIFQAIREKPRICVEALLVTRAASEGQDTHGVLLHVQRGQNLFWEESDVEVTIRNSGHRACQITDIFVESESFINQVRPEPLPFVLDPNTSVSVLIQPEWFAPILPANEKSEDPGQKDDTVLAAGVFDALGEKHNIRKESLSELVRTCRELPLRAKLYRHKETGNIITAFQSKDNARFLRKESILINKTQ